MDDTIRWAQDDGIVTLTIDDPSQQVNTLNDNFVRAFAAALDRLESERESVRGVILRSAKDSFLVGGDLNRLFAVRPEGRDAFLTDLLVRKARMRRLEQLGRPVVAVLTGAAPGGGLELALACHHRIGVDNGRTSVGLPEVTLGLLPGGGGITRVVRLLGQQVATQLAVSGRTVPAGEAAELGLLDALVTDESAALADARAWIIAHPSAQQPWDTADNLPAETDIPAAAGDGAARAAIARVVAATATASFDEAQRIEAEALADLVVSPAAKRTIQIIFFDTQRLRTRARLDHRVNPREIVVVAPDPADRQLLAERRAGKRLEIVAAPPTSDDRPLAWVVSEGREVPPGATAITLHPDRYDLDGIVAEHLEQSGHPGRLVVAALAGAGILPIPVRALATDADATNAITDRVVDPRDAGVVAVRVAGTPPWALDEIP